MNARDLIPETIQLMRCGASDESLKQHIDLIIRIAEADARIEAYRDASETITRIYSQEIAKS